MRLILTSGRSNAVLLGLAAGAAITAALVWSDSGPAKAGDSGPSPPQHFLSGSERSLTILQDIKGVLDRIDSRLERIEQGIDRISRQPPPSPPRPQSSPPATGERLW